MTRPLDPPHLVNPSANPQTALTVSGICVLNVILFGGSVHVLFNVVVDVNMTAGKEISAGSNDD